MIERGETTLLDCGSWEELSRSSSIVKGWKGVSWLFWVKTFVKFSNSNKFLVVNLSLSISVDLQQFSWLESLSTIYFLKLQPSHLFPLNLLTHSCLPTFNFIHLPNFIRTAQKIYQNVNCVTTAMTSNFRFLAHSRLLFHIIIMNSDFTASH
jgi:hypothetical protein